METGETVLDDLVAKYNKIDTPTVITHTPDGCGYSQVWYKKYILYIAIFVWTIMVVIIGRPNIMYIEDPDTKERKLKPTRVIATIMGIYISVIAVVIGVDYLKKYML